MELLLTFPASWLLTFPADAWKYCNPSRAMLLTGRYMHNVGIYANGGAPALSFALLPQRLKQLQPTTKAYMMGVRGRI